MMRNIFIIICIIANVSCSYSTGSGMQEPLLVGNGIIVVKSKGYHAEKLIWDMLISDISRLSAEGLLRELSSSSYGDQLVLDFPFGKYRIKRANDESNAYYVGKELYERYRASLDVRENNQKAYRELGKFIISLNERSHDSIESDIYPYSSIDVDSLAASLKGETYYKYGYWLSDAGVIDSDKHESHLPSALVGVISDDNEVDEALAMRILVYYDNRWYVYR